MRAGRRSLEALSFTSSVDGIPASRRWVVERARRGGCPEPSLWTIELLTTEAVANAVQHGPDGGEVTVSLSFVRGEWRVAVTDESPGVPLVHEVLPQDIGGRGVMLIDRLADAWGVESHDGTAKTVWFRVASSREE